MSAFSNSGNTFEPALGNDQDAIECTMNGWSFLVSSVSHTHVNHANVRQRTVTGTVPADNLQRADGQTRWLTRERLKLNTIGIEKGHASSSIYGFVCSTWFAI